MKKLILLFSMAVFAIVGMAADLFGQEIYRLWPDKAPGETTAVEKRESPRDIDCPMISVFFPEKEKANGKCMLLFPGGGYAFLSCYPDAFYRAAKYLTEHGFVSVVLQYRVPRRANLPNYHVAFQDAQRAIRYVRSRAKEWKIDPEKIGAMGGSAGGHLTVIAAVNSQTDMYPKTDAIDEYPAHLNFAIPLYPAYIVKEEKETAGKGICNSLELADTLHFDEKTPPMCLMHGDADLTTTPTGSIALYYKLRTMGIPADLHIYTGAPHTFVVRQKGPHVGQWLRLAREWTELKSQKKK